MAIIISPFNSVVCLLNEVKEVHKRLASDSALHYQIAYVAVFGTKVFVYIGIEHSTHYVLFCIYSSLYTIKHESPGLC